MLPPKETAPLMVTKSPTTAPCDESVAVIAAEPSVAEKVILLVEVFLIGVTSLKVPPDSI